MKRPPPLALRCKVLQDGTYEWKWVKPKPVNHGIWGDGE
jgi:hypothetical protein